MASFTLAAVITTPRRQGISPPVMGASRRRATHRSWHAALRWPRRAITFNACRDVVFRPPCIRERHPLPKNLEVAALYTNATQSLPPPPLSPRAAAGMNLMLLFLHLRIFSLP